MRTSLAHIEVDWIRDGVAIAMARDVGGGVRQVLKFAPVEVQTVNMEEAIREESDDFRLRISDDDARALYEALAEHFGHNGHDTRALRKDYDAERQRVDRLIGALLPPTQEPTS